MTVYLKDRPETEDSFDRVPLGVDPNGKELFWNVSKIPHISIIGPNLDVINVCDVINNHMQNFEEMWQYEGISEIRDFDINAMSSFEESLRNALKETEDIITLIESRLESMKPNFWENFRKSNKDYKNILLFVHIEDFLMKLPKNSLPDAEYRKYEFIKNEVLENLNMISQEGRFCGVSLAMLSRDPFHRECRDLYYRSALRVMFPVGSKDLGFMSETSLLYDEINPEELNVYQMRYEKRSR